jgi:hypothetical protein
MTPTEGGEKAGVAMAVLSAAVLVGCAYCYSLGRRVAIADGSDSEGVDLPTPHPNGDGEKESVPSPAGADS